MAADALTRPGRLAAVLAAGLGRRLVRLPPRWRLAGVVLLAAVQLAVPARWILGFERTLAEGRPVRFRAAPVDPADPLRGRYVVLGFEAAEAVPVPDGLELYPGEQVWVRVTEGPDGFARLVALSPERPPDGDDDRLRARVDGFVPAPRDEEGRTTRLELPFDRLFLEEGAAPAAEELLRAAARQPGRGPEVWAEVRLRDGQAVLEDVLVDGVPLREAVARAAAGAAPPGSAPDARRVPPAAH